MDLSSVINLKLLSHPANYLIVWTVLIFLGLAIGFVHRHQSGELPGASSQG